MSDRYYIFGAHSRAQTLSAYLQVVRPSECLAGFLYDNDEENPEKIEKYPVMRSADVPEPDRTCTVYLAIKAVNRDAVWQRLKSLGFSDIVSVTPQFDSDIRKQYFRKRYANTGRPFVMIDDLDNKKTGTVPTLAIYEVGSAYDKPLEKDTYSRKPYERTIQVGAALTDVRKEGYDLFDDTGDNISEMNRQLCEETALYWMWKNAAEDIMGLVHYRRHFIMPEDWQERMISNNVDVVLPIPICIRPGVEKNYRFRHISSDWDVLMDVLQDHSRDDHDFAINLFSKDMYFPLNIFVMRREILNDYCSWLFPILFDVMKTVGEHRDPYQNRYPAFMAERLLTLFFEMNRDRFNIVYADKGFLV